MWNRDRDLFSTRFDARRHARLGVATRTWRRCLAPGLSLSFRVRRKRRPLPIARQVTDSAASLRSGVRCQKANVLDADRVRSSSVVPTAFLRFPRYFFPRRPRCFWPAGNRFFLVRQSLVRGTHPCLRLTRDVVVWFQRSSSVVSRLRAFFRLRQRFPGPHQIVCFVAPTLFGRSGSPISDHRGAFSHRATLSFSNVFTHRLAPTRQLFRTCCETFSAARSFISAARYLVFLATMFSPPPVP